MLYYFLLIVFLVMYDKRRMSQFWRGGVTNGSVCTSAKLKELLVLGVTCYQMDSSKEMYRA